MADLPEREQADTSFDTLYHLAKKLEVCTINCAACLKEELQPMTLTPGGCAATIEADLFPPDPELIESASPEPDHIEGLSLRMTQAMNHYQKQECRYFVYGDTGHFTRDC